jgi:hypothetical protein
MIRLLCTCIAMITIAGCWNASSDSTDKKSKNGDSPIAEATPKKNDRPEKQIVPKDDKGITESLQEPKQPKQEPKEPKTDIDQKPKVEIPKKPKVQPIDVAVLHPLNFRVGQRGPIIPNPQENPNVNGGFPTYWFEVDSVLSDKNVLIREHLVNNKFYKSLRGPIKFVVEMPTEGLADNARIVLTGVMEVVGTKKVGRATYYLLR